jgi:hypothetical protein
MVSNQLKNDPGHASDASGVTLTTDITVSGGAVRLGANSGPRCGRRPEKENSRPPPPVIDFGYC